MAVALVLACSGHGGDQNDVGSDAGPDVGSDTGHDGGRQDVGPDVGPDARFADGGWTQLEGVPPRCVLYMATPDLVATTSFAIEPCADRAGCRRIASPGGPIDTNPFRVERGHGWHDGTRGMFATFSDANGYTDEWLVDDAGRGVMGFRTGQITSGDNCAQHDFDLSPTSYGLVLTRVIHPDDIADFLYRGALGAPPTLVGDLRAPFAHGWVQEIRLDALRTAAWMSFQAVQAVETDGSLSTVTPLGSGGGCAIADVVGDAIFVECSTPTNVLVQQPGGPLTALFASGANYGLDSDGTDMAWARYVPQDGGFRVELWTAPHTTSPAALTERFLASVPPSSDPQPYDLRIGFGHVAFLEQPDRIGLYRLSDGARAEILAPAGEYWSSFVQYVGPDEIALTSGVVRVAPVTDSQLMFIRLDSLTFVPP